MVNRSALRRRLVELCRLIEAILDELDTEHSTFAGVVYRLRTRCGKPTCVCLEGDLHTAWCASYAEGDRRRLRTVTPARLQELKAQAERYRRLRQQRAKIAKTFRELLRVFDRLERSLRVPPGRAIPDRREREE